MRSRPPARPRGGTLDSDDDLAQQFAAGAPDALAEAYSRHGRLMHSLCLAALGQREDAEDAVQQVFTRAWRSRTSFDPQRPLGGWLTGIARRVIADSYAARSREQRVSETTTRRLRTPPPGASRGTAGAPRPSVRTASSPMTSSTVGAVGGAGG